MAAETSFDRMVDALGRNAKRSGLARRRFISLSAGVNWQRPAAATVALLTHELRAALSTRNYGNAGGAPAAVRVLQRVEDRLHGCRGLAVTLAHGASEGASLVLDDWCGTGQLRAGDRVLALGHVFGLYAKLSVQRGLDYHECLGDEGTPQTFLPTADAVADALETLRPRLVVVLLPNNPLGEIIDLATLQRIVHHVRAHDGRLLVDRVCLMPLDAPAHVRELLGPLVLEGRAAMVDSFAKGESLAGLRTGFLVTDADAKSRIVEAIRPRYLNPPVFGSATLAVTRAARLGEPAAHRMARAYRHGIAHDRLFGEYPPEETFQGFFRAAEAALPALARETAARAQEIRDNFERLAARFGGRATRALRLDGGFNVALELEAMDARREADDALELAAQRDLGVLSSRCFCQQSRARRYFLRIGLTLPGTVFEEGLERLDAFYPA